MLSVESMSVLGARGRINGEGEGGLEEGYTSTALPDPPPPRSPARRLSLDGSVENEVSAGRRYPDSLSLSTVARVTDNRSTDCPMTVKYIPLLGLSSW